MEIEAKMTIQRKSKAGQLIEVGPSLDGNWIVAQLDGRRVSASAGISKAQPHQYGDEFTHQIGKILLSSEEAEKINAAREAILRKRKEAKARKLENISGLTELRAAIEEQNRYANEFARMMEDENNDGVRPPRPAEGNIDELVSAYPRAALYIKAESYSRASHYLKADAGEKAMKMLEDGADTAAVEYVLSNWMPEDAAWR